MRILRKWQARWEVAETGKKLLHPQKSDQLQGDMSHIMTNQQYGICAQRRLRSAWASTQSDQSLRCSHEESLGP